MKSTEHYWHETRFKILHGAWRNNPKNPQYLEVLAEKFLYPHARNVLKQAGYRYDPAGGDREDLIQSAVVMAMRKLGHYRPSEGTGFNFFWRVMLNRMLTMHRRGAKRLKRIMGVVNERNGVVR